VQRKSATTTFRGNEASLRALLLLLGFCFWFAWLPAAHAQLLGGEQQVTRIEIKHVGPASVSDELIRANIRSKAGEPYHPITVDDDVRNLYTTGLFYNVQVSRISADGGITLTYIVQANPRLTEIKVEGNSRMSLSKIQKKISSKVGDPLQERKLFNDSLAIEELYKKAGYPSTEIKYVSNIDEATGRGTATFKIKESPKIKIASYEFVDAAAFSQATLRTEMLGWWRKNFAWMFGYGKFQEEKFEEAQDKLREFYRGHGYIDFEVKEVEYLYPKTNALVFRIHLFEGRQYHVGKVTFEGTTMLPTNAVSPDYKPGKAPKGPERVAWSERGMLNRDFKMKEGSVFTAEGQTKDTQAVQNFYDGRGYIDVGRNPGDLLVRRIPNTENATIDLNYTVKEGQKSFIEKIEIRGNTKTKDKVIRRELAVSPGETFDMVRVRVSKYRLEGLDYFAKVDARPVATDVPNRDDLLIGVEEKNTGNLSFGAGFSSVDSIVGFAEITQGNFDLFHPPTFTGGGQKFRLRVQLGTERQDVIVSFVEPWFLDRKLAFGTELYHRKLDFQSVDNLYDEARTGVRVSLERALWSDFVRGSVFYKLEQVGILLNPGVHGMEFVDGPDDILIPVWPTAPQAILSQAGYSMLSTIGGNLTYDTRNNVRLPNAGQRTELLAEITTPYLGGQMNFYKLELQSAWYFKGLGKGHVLEIGGRIGVADGMGGDIVPFYEAYYLGGLYSLRGFEYRAISPRELNPNPALPPGTYFSEPVGGNTYWFASAEYSVPIFKTDDSGSGLGARAAIFYDVGSVGAAAYDLNASDYSANWGLGLRLNLPIGPLRLDYGIPLKHDQFSDGKGKFQFGVGWQRPF
jgi:outer membrane protein insertion porin family